MVNVAILGFGVVGSGVAEVLATNGEHIDHKVEDLIRLFPAHRILHIRHVSVGVGKNQKLHCVHLSGFETYNGMIAYKYKDGADFYGENGRADAGPQGRQPAEE